MNRHGNLAGGSTGGGTVTGTEVGDEESYYQVEVTLADGSGTLLLRFLNFYPSHQKTLAPGQRVRVFGDTLEMTLSDLTGTMFRPGEVPELEGETR